MNAFVLGATGYVGRAVVEQLAAAGDGVVAHIRPDSPRLQQWQERFGGFGAQTDASPFDRDVLRDRFADLQIDTVFALLGTTRERGGDYMAVDYGLTRVALDAALEQERPPQFIYLSSLGAGSPGRGAYLEARTRFEADLLASGLNGVIARPSFITGPGRDQTRLGERIAGAVSDVGLAPLGWIGLGDRRDRLRSIDNQQLAAGLIAVARRQGDGVSIHYADSLRPKG